MTTYDQIWVSFLTNCKVSDIDLPTIPERIYDCIHNAIRHMNNRLRTKMTWNDDLEVVNEELSDDQLLILSHYIRLIFIINQKTYFESTWQPFARDIGLKNFSAQLKSLENSIDSEEKKIDQLIANTEEDYL